MGTFDGLFTNTATKVATPTPSTKDRFANLFTPAPTTPTAPKVTTTQLWNGQKIPSNIPTKNLVSYDPITGYKTFNLGNASPGVYTTDANNKIVKSGHTTYGGVAPVKGMQRDDIIPQGLGGANANAGNIKLIPNKVATQQDKIETNLSQQVKQGLPPKQAINTALAQKSQIANAPSFWQKVQGVLGDIGQGFGKVGLGVVHQDMGVQAGTVGGKKVPSTIPNPFAVALQTDAEIPGAIRKAAFGTLIAPLLGAGAQIKQQFGGQGQIDLSKIGIPKVDSFSRNVQANVDNGMPTWEAIIMEVPNIVAAGMGLDAIGTHSVLKLADIAQEKTTTPITFRDMQNITTGKENLVAPDVLKAYKTATIEHPELVGQIKKGTIEVPNAPKATLFSNFLKNAATRPVSEISNLFDTFGRDTSVSNTKLLADPNSPFAHELVAPENKPFAHEALTKPFAHEIAPVTPQTAPETAITPKVDNSSPLSQEATKYKSAEEFVKAQQGDTVTLYHGSPDMPTTGNWRKGTMFADTEQNARYYASSHHEGNIIVQQVEIPKNIVEKNRSNNIHNLKEEYPVAKSTQTKSQLTDIWNKANKPVEPTVSEPAQQGKTAKAASDINTNLVKKRFDTIPQAEQAKYTPVQKADQIQKISELMTTDLEKAKAIARGDEPVPSGILPQPLFNAIEAHATTNGDVQLLRDLANSPIATQLSEAGQTLGSHGFNDNPNSAVAKIQEVSKAREQASIKKYGTKAKTAGVKDIKNEIAKTAPKAKDWASFIDQLKCT